MRWSSKLELKSSVLTERGVKKVARQSSKLEVKSSILTEKGEKAKVRAFARS